MKLKYSYPKGSRTDLHFVKMTALPKPLLSNGYSDFSYIYNTKTKKWVSFLEYQTQKKNNIPFIFSLWCCSIKAFRRRLKKAPAGVRFELYSRYIKGDVIGVGTCKALF